MLGASIDEQKGSRGINLFYKIIYITKVSSFIVKATTVTRSKKRTATQHEHFIPTSMMKAT